jgi:heme/copper-type cytochrome/quinol oxidase subunit 2
MEPQRSDQEQFDAAVDHTGKTVLEVLAGLAILAAFLMSMVALVQSGKAREVRMMVSPSTRQAAVVSAPTKVIDTKVEGGVKRGPDGKMHDMFTVTNFNVKVGQPVKVRIDNTDDVPHSITSAAAGVNIIAQPGLHTYTMTVAAAGKFQWNCMLPCDTDVNGWAMQHPGYMSGYITAS